MDRWVSKSVRLVAAVVLLSGIGMSIAQAADKAEIVAFRLANAEGQTRLVFDLSGPVEHSVFTLSKPERVVIDIQNVLLRTELPISPDIPYLTSIRNAPRNGESL